MRGTVPLTIQTNSILNKTASYKVLNKVNPKNFINPDLIYPALLANLIYCHFYEFPKRITLIMTPRSRTIIKLISSHARHKRHTALCLSLPPSPLQREKYNFRPSRNLLTLRASGAALLFPRARERINFKRKAHGVDRIKNKKEKR